MSISQMATARPLSKKATMKREIPVRLVAAVTLLRQHTDTIVVLYAEMCRPTWRVKQAVCLHARSMLLA